MFTFFSKKQFGGLGVLEALEKVFLRALTLLQAWMGEL
jgi:hypothetical protein